MNAAAFGEAPYANDQAERQRSDAMPSRASSRAAFEAELSQEQAKQAEAEATQRVLRQYQRDHQGNALIGGFREDHGHQVTVVLSQTGILTVKHGSWTALQLSREQAATLADLLNRASS